MRKLFFGAVGLKGNVTGAFDTEFPINWQGSVFSRKKQQQKKTGSSTSASINGRRRCFACYVFRVFFFFKSSDWFPHAWAGVFPVECWHLSSSLKSWLIGV